MEASPTAKFSGRYAHEAVVFDGKLWLLAGLSADGPKNDVWCTTDGFRWDEAASAAAFTPRYYPEAVVFKGNLWLIAGTNQGRNGLKNDVWRSADGITWVEVSPAAASQPAMPRGWPRWTANCG